MTQGDEWKWMISKLSGNSSPEEENLLTNWINASKQNQVLFDEVTKIWVSSSIRLTLNNPATEDEWKKLQDRIQNEKVKTNWISLPQTWLAAAASIIILIGAIYFLRPDTTQEQQTVPLANEQEKEITKPEVTPQVKEVDHHIHIATSSQVKTVKLPDGSQVWLNSNSTLSYLPDFTKNRLVELDGEAYFIVTHDKKHPFSVHTQRVTTLVVGTSFNIKEIDSTVYVTVAKGTVKMTADQKALQVMIGAEEKGVFQNGKLTKTPNTQSAFATWREKNNPSYEKEKNSPSTYLSNSYSWKKNNINRSIIEGSLTNTASLATYHRIVLKATYIKPKSKKEITIRIPIQEPVRPGQTINYQKKLLDILTHTHAFKVEVEKVEVIPNQYF